MRGITAVRASLAGIARRLAVVGAAIVVCCAALSASAGASTLVQGSEPSVAGVARDGQRLHAEHGSWSGAKPISYAYSWSLCDASGASCETISGADRRVYKLGHGDVGQTLRVTVTATAAGQSASAVSAASEAVAPAALQARKRPKLSGGALDGRVLSVDTGTWRGTPPQSFSYRWQECRPHGACVDIPGATGADYRADTAQIGAKLRAIVTATNAAGSASAASGSSKLVAAGSPVALAPPTIAGTLQEGATLQASAGEWAGTPSISYSFQWLRCSVLGGGCERIAGATEPSYTPGVADIASNLAVTVTASNAQGSTSATSSETQPILGILPTNSLLPSISGVLRDGGLLSGAIGEWSGSAPISYSYQWELCNAAGEACKAIDEAIGATLALSPADVGSTVRLAVKATNVAGSTTAFSPASSVIAALLPSNTSLPSIGGLLKLGKELTASTGSWSGTTPMTFGYQWQLCNPLGGGCANILKATSPTFALGALDLGGTLRVIVTATNAAGPTSATSAATGLIEGLL